MDIKSLAPYAKTVAAVAGAVVTTATLVSDGEINADDIIAIVTVWATVFGVFQVTNKPTLKSILKNEIK